MKKANFDRIALVNQIFKQPLFVLEMANNHMGSVSHGKRIIEEFAAVTKKFPFRFAFKFQLRDLDTFIHPSFRQKEDHKYVKRFSETRLTLDQLAELKKTAEDFGFLSMCTPFDEKSVGDVVRLGFSVIKIASCSFTDWPLLEVIARIDRPIIASTAGATLEQIDSVALFLRNRSKKFALLHCIGEYPTKAEHFELNQIDLLRNRYPNLPIGFSTHEEPENLATLPLVIAKGAVIFEKHVGVKTDQYALNAYSATPKQFEAWLEAAQKTFSMCGVPPTHRSRSSVSEQADLRQFKRGIFATKKIRKGEKISTENTFMAFPCQEGQFLANDFSKYISATALEDISELAPVSTSALRIEHTRAQLHEIARRAQKLLTEANSVVPGMSSLEISHHYGLEKFNETGCLIIDVVNRAYCKKLIVLLAGQNHPEQFHKRKEETFVILHGEVKIQLDGVTKMHQRGDVITVGKGVKHSFSSVDGAVIEEISSTHFKDDSFYTDPKIPTGSARKSILHYWMDLE